VVRAITRLGYVVNQQARSLAGGRSMVVGLVTHNLHAAYFGEIIQGIDNELASAAYDLMLYTTHRRKVRESTYVATLTQGLADGLLLILPRHPEAYLATLRRSRFPYVLIDHQGIDEAGPAVGVTNRQGAYDMTRYLIELGHQRIGFITGTLDVKCAADRLAGYYDALAEHGLSSDPALVQEGDFLQPQAYTCARKLLALPQPPTAIFASNDLSAFGVMEAVRDCGLRIPADISIAGFDDIPQASQIHPPLTTVRQPLQEMGRRATLLLLEQIEQPEHPAACITLPTNLVVRQSCQAPATV